MAQKFQRIAVKPKAAIFKINDWVDVPDPFGKHPTRKAVVVGVSSDKVSVKPCFTHFTPEVLNKRFKSFIAPNKVECKMLEEVHHFAREVVKLASFR
jgi:hypothetical protein